MCYDIMFQILLHQKRNEATTALHHHDHHHKRDDSTEINDIVVTRKYHILDVGCGTGILWEYLFDAFKSIVIQNEHNHHHFQHDHGHQPCVHDCRLASPTYSTTTTRYELNITGIDLSSKMVSYAKERASHMIKKHVSIMNHSNGSGGSGNNRPLHNDRDFVIVKPKITVIQGDIMDYCSNATGTSNNNNNTVDGVIINACYGNFYNPRSVLEVLPNHSIICISHPLGNTFVHKLHDKDPITVPHVLPEEESNSGGVIDGTASNRVIEDNLDESLTLFDNKALEFEQKRFKKIRKKTEFFRQESCEEGIKQFINKLISNSGKREYIRTKEYFQKKSESRSKILFKQ